jgi:hypothetical protein
MKIYQVGRQHFAIIENELWVKADSVPDAQPLQAVPTKRPYNLKKTFSKTGRKVRHNLDAETKSRIREEYRNGKSQADLAEEFGISSITVYRIVKSVGPIGGLAKERKHNQVPLKEINGYRCLNCGHTFKSILPKLEAYCPKPTCNKADELEEIPAEEVV